MSISHWKNQHKKGDWQTKREKRKQAKSERINCDCKQNQLTGPPLRFDDQQSRYAIAQQIDFVKSF